MKKVELLIKLDELARRLRDEAKQVEKMRRDYESPSAKKHESRRSGQRKKYRLEVTFPWGTIIKGERGDQVFIKAIEEMDFKEVAELEIMAVKTDGTPLVSSHLPTPKRQEYYKQRGRYYIYTNNSTDEKMKYLEEISKRLKINMKVKSVPV